ncbi:MAG: hypothetical protein JNK72_04055 [Myxococcales bacterium]|nr:hypothetical protein [Myxococcales bacterium]
MASRLAKGLVALALSGVLGSCADYGDTVCDEPSGGCFRTNNSQALTLRVVRARNPPLPEGSPVNVRSVIVTAYDSYDEDMSGSVGALYAQEYSPVGDATDPWAPCPITADRRYRVCAISLFSPTLAPTSFIPRAGDIVDLVGGAYDEFDCSGVCGSPPQPFANGRFIPQVSRGTARQAGVATAPTPLAVTLDDIVNHNAELMGILVTVENVTLMGAPDRRGEIALTAGRDGLKLTQEFTPIADAAAGTRFSRITGVVTFFYGPKLVPRSTADLVR